MDVDERMCPAPRRAGDSGHAHKEPPTKRLAQQARLAAERGRKREAARRSQRAGREDRIPGALFNPRAQIKPAWDARKGSGNKDG